MFIVDIQRCKLAVAFSHPLTDRAKATAALVQKTTEALGANISKGQLKAVRKALQGTPHSTRQTVCTLVDVSTQGSLRILTEGSVNWPMVGHFSKGVGRKIALTRAVCQHVYNFKTRQCRKCRGKFTAFATVRLTKDERTQIWKTYFDRGVHVVKAEPVVETHPVPGNGEIRQLPLGMSIDKSSDVVAAHSRVPLQNAHGLGYAGAD